MDENLSQILSEQFNKSESGQKASTITVPAEYADTHPNWNADTMSWASGNGIKLSFEGVFYAGPTFSIE